MILTLAQLATLRTDILADGVLAALPRTSDGADAIVQAYKVLPVPAYIVWRSGVSIKDVGDNLVGTDLAGLSTLNHTRLQTVVMLSTSGVNPSLPDRRQFFDDIFSGSGGAATRAKLLILWKRSANRLEKLFATGPGIDATPSTMTAEGVLTVQNVLDALAN